MSQPKKKASGRIRETQAKRRSKTGPALDLVNVPSLPAKVKSKDDDRQLQIETTLVKMGIDRHDLSTIAPITEILKNADGGIPEVIRALRFSIEPFIEQFFDQYDGATEEDRALLPLEAFILKADIDEAQFIGEAILMLQNTSANIVKIIA